MRRIGEHAVVIGGSVAGLLAARALTEAYDRVTVIDRDALPDGVADRRAVPQGRHAHALLPLGQRCLEQLLPGAVDALVADGAASCAALEEYRFVVSGSRLAPVSTGNRTVFASRPFIEGHVRARVRALGGEPDDSARAWGGLVQAIEGASKLLGDGAALRALREGEEHGLRDYRDALSELDLESRRVVQDVLLPAQLLHIQALDAMISRLGPGGPPPPSGRTSRPVV